MTTPFDPAPSDPGRLPAQPAVVGAAATFVSPTVWGPEPTARDGQGVQVASLGRRALAYVLDGLVIAAVTFAVVIVVLLIAAGASGGSFSFSATADANSSSKELLELAGIFGLALAFPLAYWMVLPGRPGIWLGRSIGKRTLDLQVITVEGAAITAHIVRKRGLLIVGPTLVAAVAGPLLDAVAGTSPVFTTLLLSAAYLYALADIVVAPLVGEQRRTLHDRLSGTVVVDVRTAPAFMPTLDATGAPVVGADQSTPPIGRPKTWTTWAYGIGGSVLIVIAVAVLVAGTGGSAATTTLATDDLSVTAADSESRALEVALVLGKQYGRCFGHHGGDLDQCHSAHALGLPSGNLKIVSGRPPIGSDSSVGQAILSSAGMWGREGGAIGVYDGSGNFWGYLVTPDAHVLAVCANGDHSECGDKTSDPVGYRFMNDRTALNEILREMESA